MEIDGVMANGWLLGLERIMLGSTIKDVAPLGVSVTELLSILKKVEVLVAAWASPEPSHDGHPKADC